MGEWVGRWMDVGRKHSGIDGWVGGWIHIY